TNVTINPTSGNAPLTLALWRASSAVDPCDPCAAEVDLDARVGNYLFRVEVHQVQHNIDGSLQLTVKWSSENGAEQHRFDQLPPGFKQGNWVYEFFNLSCEENLGVHLAKGFIPSRGQLSTTLPSVAPSGNPWVRRWDGCCVLNCSSGGAWSFGSGSDKGVLLATGLDSESHGYVAVGANLELNLAAMAFSLGLSTHQFVAGDYWLAEVREATHAPGSTLLNGVPPQGVKHHYLVLAELDSAGVVQVSGDDADRRRMEFPPLSDLWAKDVGYDPEECGESPAQNVQQALDWLCQQRDLRFHNKHLHGWGIVCGLQVECGSDTELGLEEEEAVRRQVRIRKGYAIDCEGHDVVFDSARIEDIMVLVEAYDAAHPDSPLLADGNGTISLTIERGQDGAPVLKVEKYDPKQETWAKMLDGTLLMDFYQDCIKDLVDALKDELTADPEEKNALVGPTLRRWISLLNLIIQIFNHDNGQYIFLSRKEHAILRAFYQRLQNLLRSKTFCAMFEGDEFPEYPFEDTGLSTIFGKGWHTRLRLAPDGKQVYTCGAADNTIHVFDTEKEEMIAEIMMPAGEGAMVVDVAVDPSGKALYAIAVLKTGDTVIGIADIDGQGAYAWRPVRVFCGIKFTCLLISHDSKTLWAIGQGAGLFAFDPGTVLTGTNRPDPKYQFNATGQLSLDQDSNQAWATAFSGAGITSVYNQVVGMVMSQVGSNLNPQKTITLVNPASGAVMTGRDDLLVVSAKDSGGIPYLCVVASKFDANDQNKHVLVYQGDIFATSTILKHNLLVENSAVRLGWHTPAHRLMVTVEDGYRLQLFNLDNGVTTSFRHPLQISPMSIASDTPSDRVYVLNFVSNTISIIPGSELETSEIFLSSLKEYRDDALGAFWGLAGGLLQYLK
ncbi:MAG: hypothetical protein Q8J76_11890, partial [Desulfobulbaceae bacterium]|nr:hypothetical protein [Desulfobulbaceae bacterium]